MISVYHKRSTDFVTAHAVLSAAEIEHVADVRTDDLNVAYALTNHIDKEWWLHPHVTCIRKSRSTSVGDVMSRDGRWYVVDIIGFKPATVAAP